MIVVSSIVVLYLVTALKLKYIIKESESLEDFLGVHMEQVDGRLNLSQPGLLDQEVRRHCGASRQQAICANSYTH